jgi:hypothetical protein
LTLASAWLLASVPPLVNMTASGLAPTSAATLALARSSARRAARPKACTEDALPIRPSSSAIASITSGRTGALAL